jgi:hypothetical protein
MTIEQRMDQLEKRNKRLTVALTMTVVAMAAVVTMAATGDKDGRFDTVVVRHIWVKNDAGEFVVSLGADDGGDGLVRTMSAKGKDLVQLSATVNDHGIVTTLQPNGKRLLMLGATDDGGGVVVFNKTGEAIAQMKADEYGNGVVGAYNRKGMGRTLQPGP